MSTRFFLAFLATLIAFLALNGVAAHLQSDCGIRAVIGLWLPSFKYCADDIVRIGFPLRFLEEGGIAFRSNFNWGALIANVFIAVAVSGAVGWLAQRARK